MRETTNTNLQGSQKDRPLIVEQRIVDIFGLSVVSVPGPSNLCHVSPSTHQT